jgi:NAD+ synthase
MDLILYGLNHGFSSAEIGTELGMAETQVERVFQDIQSKRRAAEYLHAPPALVEPL